MNLALLGDDAAVWPLISALLKSTAHRLTVAALPGELSNRLTALAPTVRQTSQWDGLLVDREVDAVILSGSSELVLEAARRLHVPPSECLVYEDTDPGIESARRAGMSVVDVRTIYTPRRVTKG